MIKTPIGAALPVGAIEVNMLTYDDANRLFSYDADTGVIRWKIKHSRKVVPGQVAGSVNGHGYRHIRVEGVFHKAHRLVWLLKHGAWPEHDIDHVNGMRDDNRFANLRAATATENLQNLAMKSNNKSGFMGVSWYKKTGSWRADICVSGRQTYLGSFHDINDAAAAYAKAKSELHTFQPIARAS